MIQESHLKTWSSNVVSRVWVYTKFLQFNYKEFNPEHELTCAKFKRAAEKEFLPNIRKEIRWHVINLAIGS